MCADSFTCLILQNYNLLSWINSTRSDDFPFPSIHDQSHLISMSLVKLENFLMFLYFYFQEVWLVSLFYALIQPHGVKSQFLFTFLSEGGVVWERYWSVFENCPGALWTTDFESFQMYSSFIVNKFLLFRIVLFLLALCSE